MIKKKRILSLLLTFIFVFTLFSQVYVSAVYANTANDVFSDIKGHRAEARILEWSDKGIIYGHAGKFYPDEGITRAEFCAIINRIFGFTEKSDTAFSDVKPVKWYSDVVKIARNAGYISGYGNNLFGPEDTITKQDASKILNTVFGFKTLEGQNAAQFSDHADISAYAKQAVETLASKGYLSSENNHFYPRNKLTRAEFVEILDKIINGLYNAAGTYKGLKASDNVIVNTGDVELKDMVIEGNLYLTSGIGQGNVTLNNVTVKGTTFANGGGENSIIIENSSLVALVVMKVDGKIRIVAKDSTVINNTQVNSGAILESDGSTGGSFENVEILQEILPGQNITLDGDFESVSVEAPGINLSIPDGSVGTLNVADNAAGSNININQGATVGTLVAQAPINVSGQGNINTANIKSENVVIEKKPDKTTISEGITANIDGKEVNNSNANNSSNQNTQDPPAPPQSQWSLVWSDEFDGSAVDTTKWSMVNSGGGFGNQEAQYYSPDNASVSNGKLIITAEKEKHPNAGSEDYTSAKLVSEYSKKYGKIEAKIKMPVGSGIWPAFWMMPQGSEYGGWASSGEIDIMEARGRLPGVVCGTLHYGAGWPNNVYTGKDYIFPAGQSINEFHTYAVEWEPGEIRWYVDGELYQTQNNWFTVGAEGLEKYSFPAPFDQEFFIQLNLAIGGTFDGMVLPPDDIFNSPVTMEVDYVRVYELTGRPYKTPVEPVIAAEAYPAGAKQSDGTGNLISDVNYENGLNDNQEGVDADFGDGWNFVHNAQFNGVATAAVEEISGTNYAKINVTNKGTQTYSVQLEQLTTLVKGRWYRFSFDAKADKIRTLNNKLGGGPTAGWLAYTPDFTADLSTEFASFSYEFQMAKASDILTRIEFNCGTDTGAVWIGNVRLEEIDAPVVDYNEEKEPLADGNHIHNGAFDKYTIDRMACWNTVKTDSSASVLVPESTRELKADITNGGSSAASLIVNQQGLKLLKDNDYRLTFKARADQGRTIKVMFTDSQGNTYLSEQEITLTTSMQTYEVTFTMTADSDNDSVLKFLLGGNSSDVYIDDVRLIKTTIDFTGVDLYPLGNGDFSLGLYKWVPFTEGAGAAFSVSEGEAKIAVSNVGSAAWNIMLYQGGLKMTSGIEYELSFNARTTANRNIEVTLENSTNERRFQTGEIAVTSEAQTYNYTFRATSNEDLALKFLMGRTSNAVTGDIYIDNIILRAKNAPVSCPPTLAADTSNNRVGQSMEIMFGDNADWRSNVTEVKVNNVVLADTKYSLTAGNLTILPEVFTSEGSYNVIITATGFADAKVTQDVLANDGNVVRNGDFSDGTTNWSNWAGDGAVVAHDVVSGASNINISNIGPQNWSVQVFQENVAIEAGKTYKLSLKASSAVARPIQVELTGYKGNESVKFNLTSDLTTYNYFISVPEADSSFKLNFLLGNVTNGSNTTPSEAHTIYIDDVVISEVVVNDSPSLNADTTDIVVGNDISITFTDDSDWRAAINAVKVDGSAINSSKYSLSAGSLIIDADVFSEGKTYVITVEAEGYYDAQVSQPIESGIVWVETGENLLANADFSTSPDTSWSIHNQGIYEAWAGLADFAVVDGAMEATVNQVGWDWWQIQLFQEHIPVPAGTYKISFDMKSELERPVYVELTGSSAPRQTYTAGNTMESYESIITVGSGSYKFMFGLGRAGSDPTLTTPYKITIDNVKLIAVGQEAPEIHADTSNNWLGEDITITLGDNEEWESAITAVKLNDTILDTSSYIVTGDAIVIDADQFPSADTYEVSVSATGYANASVSQVIEPAWVKVGDNLIDNGSFTTPDAIWLTHNQGLYEAWAGKAGFSTVDGVMNIEVQQVGWDWWHIQLFQENIAVTAGTYLLEFDLDSDVVRPFYVELVASGAPRIDFSADTVNKTYKAILNVAGNGSYKFMFGFGRAGTPELPVPYMMYLDNVKLTKVER